MRLKEVLEALRGVAPEHLADGWDKVGLQVGDPGWAVKKGLLCIDLTEAVLAEAESVGASLIVAYHPLVFEPVGQLTGATAKERVLMRCVAKRIAVYSPHTALDAVVGGVNDWLCDGLGAGERSPIKPVSAGESFKVVTFVPHDRADGLRAAMSAAGAGVIGDYTECSFGVDGEGTFRGGAGTNPAVGRHGRFERVSELRIEIVCGGGCLGAVVEALRATHPYEEPAFDVYRLEAVDSRAAGSGVGHGRVVELDRPVSPGTLARRVKERLGVDDLKVAVPGGMKTVRRVGVCVGAGGSLLEELGGAGGVDAFVTGEMRHHDVLAAVSGGTAVMLAGHTETERPYLPVYRGLIAKAVKGAAARSRASAVRWVVSRVDRPPLRGL